jgi:malonyl-CoA O-methyltransferase
MNIFNSPEKYADAAIIAKEASDQLLACLEWMTIKPNVIVDAGCGTGFLTRQLKERFPFANVIGLDNSTAMLNHCQQQTHDINLVNANCLNLPFADKSVDLITANLVLPWLMDFKKFLYECKRVLRPEGLLYFTALGLDTLHELPEELKKEIIPFVIDMHNIGDLLLEVGLIDPVLDTNYYTLAYQDKNKLINELINSSMILHCDLPAISPLVTNLNLTYEIIQAHAFASDTMMQVKTGNETSIPLSSLRQSLRSSGR